MKIPKIKFSYIFWGLFFVLIFSILLKNSYSYLDPDLGWHLKAGEEIINHRNLPRINHYNYTLLGTSWVDHEWLSNAIIFWIYNQLGYLPLNLLFAALITLALAILVIFAKKELKGQTFTIIILTIFGLLIMAPHLGIRVQEITILNLLILYLITYYYNQTKNFKLLLILPPFFYFWASLHGGFLIGLFFLGFWLGIKILEAFFPWKKLNDYLDSNSKFKSKELLIFLLFIILSFLATCLTPYRLELYSFLSDYQNTYYMSRIKEWFPVWTLPFDYPRIIYLAIIFGAIILNIFEAIKSKGKNQKINLFELGITLIFLFLSFRSLRHFPLIFIVSFPFLIKFFKDFFSQKDEEDDFLAKTSPFIKIYIVITFLTAIASSSAYTWTEFTPDPFQKFCADYPCQAVEFLKSRPEYADLKIFNEYGWGGYLIWTYPEKKLFISGHLPQYPFKGRTILEEYDDFFTPGLAEEKLDEYAIKMVLLKKEPKDYQPDWLEKFIYNNQQFSNRRNILSAYLNSDPTWVGVYADEAAEIFIKNQ